MDLTKVMKTLPAAAFALFVSAFVSAACAQNTISAAGPTTLMANNEGNLGVLFPLINGRASTAGERERFVYEIRVNAQFVSLTDAGASTFYYVSYGYDALSPNNQWAFWEDGIWFRPVTRNYTFRVGYPANGQTGGNVGNNWVTYQFVGNPNAPRPNDNSNASIAIGTPENAALAGWTLHWSDEFDGTELDRNKWTPDIGYYLNNNAGTWGWGNEEKQHYRDHPDNVYVQNGYLNLTAFRHRQNWPAIDPGRYAEYASGKVVTRDKFYWKYGRIDFCASLPLGAGFWPALWMMPQEDFYGSWALSGEIDVMEAKGRIAGASSGAIHFGGAWPDNTYRHGDYTFPAGRGIQDFNVYTLIWEADTMMWYVNGNCFLTSTSSQWRSNATSAQGNNRAPFDRDFFLIMNLAVGGHFDNFRTPPDNLLPAAMRIDYVRVYKPGDPAALKDPKTVSRTHIGQNAAFTGISNGQIYLNLPAGTYSARLYDLRGKTIAESNINAINGINASGLKTGKFPKSFVILHVKNANGADVLKQRILVR